MSRDRRADDRILGTTGALGAAGLVVLVDDLWVALRLMRRVQLVMFALIAVAAVRAGTSSSRTVR